MTDRPVRLGVIALAGQSVSLKVDHFHREGETVFAHSLFSEPGGKGYNQAIAAKRFGAEVVCLTAVGRDTDGEACVHRLEQEGIKTLVAWKDAPTTYASILSDQMGRNRVTVFQDPRGALTAADVATFAEELSSCDAILAQFEYPVEVVEAALCLEKRMFLNPAPAQVAPDKLYTQCEWIIPNEQEACSLLGLKQDASLDDMTAAFRARGLCHVVVTLGELGCLVIDGDTAQAYPAWQTEAVNTTGAGDTFCAAFTVKRLKGFPVPECIAFATAAASLSVEHEHVLGGLPAQDDAHKREILVSNSWQALRVMH